MEKLGKKFGAKVLDLLDGRSQSKAAEFAKIDASWLSKVIQGKGGLKAPQLRDLAKFLDTTIDYLVNDDAEDPRSPRFTGDEIALIYLCRSLDLDIRAVMAVVSDFARKPAPAEPPYLVPPEPPKRKGRTG
jgi:transcriptional regulator with XRE-family HTH domain